MSGERNAKNDFTPVNSESVLDRVAALPLTTWSYKTEQGVRHFGLMTQDFYAAFGLNGKDDKHISVIDEGGWATNGYPIATASGTNSVIVTPPSQMRCHSGIQALEYFPSSGTARWRV